MILLSVLQRVRGHLNSRENSASYYSLSVTQNDDNEVPFDQDGLLGTYSLFFMISAVMVVLQLFSARRMTASGISKHPAIRLLTLAVIIWSFFVFCEMIHYIVGVE